MSDDSNDALFDGLLRRLNDLEPVPAPALPPKLDDIANMLATFYGHVVILVTEKDPEKDESILHYCWRGGYYAARGMLDRMKDIMRNDGQVEDDDE